MSTVEASAQVPAATGEGPWKRAKVRSTPYLDFEPSSKVPAASGEGPWKAFKSMCLDSARSWTDSPEHQRYQEEDAPAEAHRRSHGSCRILSCAPGSIWHQTLKHTVCRPGIARGRRDLMKDIPYHILGKEQGTDFCPLRQDLFCPVVQVATLCIR